jgi:hypothetical protein
MKKVLVFTTITIILIKLTSCHAYLDISSQKEYEAYQDKSHIYVLHLKTNQDSTIYFSESFPGKMSEGEVVVVSLSEIQMKYNITDSIIFKNHKPVPRYFWKNGTKYQIIERDNFFVTGVASDTMRFPFSEIKQMHIKKINTGKTVALIIGCSVAGAGLVFGALNLLIYLAFSDGL